MWMVAANFRHTHSPSQLAWSEGWRPPGAQFSKVNIVVVIIIIIIFIFYFFTPTSTKPQAEKLG